MIVLPLGLRAKLYIKPWATIAIALITIGFSTIGLLGQKEAIEFKNKTLLAHDLHNLSYIAIKHDCKTSFSEIVCTFFEGYLKAEDLARTDLAIDKIEKFEAFDRSTKEKLKNYIQNLPIELALQNEIYATAAKSFTQEFVGYSTDHFLLSPENTNLQSLTLALWQHQNWWMLFGNLLLLGLFSLFLEQRIGPVFVLGLYLCGGFAGAFLQVKFANSYAWVSAGASGVMAVIGAYAFFFFKEKVQFLKSLTVPGWLYISLLFIAGNALYLDSNFIPDFDLWAHSLGFFFGILLGFLISLLVWVQADFLFEAEQYAFFKAKKTTLPLKKITHCLEVLEINPYNFTATEYLIKSLAKYHIEWADVPEGELKEIGHLLVRMINQEFPVVPSQIYSIISLLPISWNFTLVPMPRLEKKELHRIENQILQNDWRLALRLYDLYLSQHPSPRAQEAIITMVNKLIVNAESPMNPEYHQNIEWLRVYVLFNGKTVISLMLADKYDDKTAAS